MYAKTPSRRTSKTMFFIGEEMVFIAVEVKRNGAVSLEGSSRVENVSEWRLRKRVSPARTRLLRRLSLMISWTVNINIATFHAFCIQSVVQRERPYLNIGSHQ